MKVPTKVVPELPTMGQWDDFCKVFPVPFDKFQEAYAAMVAAAAPAARSDAGLVERLRYQLGHLENAVKDVRTYGAEHVLADGPEGCETHRSALEWLELITLNTVRYAKEAAATLSPAAESGE